MIKEVFALLLIVHISRILAQRLARRLTQLRTSRCLRESDERQHMQKNQINSNEQSNKHHEMIKHDF